MERPSQSHLTLSSFAKAGGSAVSPDRHHHLGHHLLNLVILREAEDLLLSLHLRLLLLLSLPSRPSTLPTMRDHEYFVYIIASRSRNIYTGITNNLLVR